MKRLTHATYHYSFLFITGLISVLAGAFWQSNFGTHTYSLRAGLTAPPQAVAVNELPPLPPTPIINQIPQDIELTAQAAIAIDEETDTLLYQQNPDAQLFPASTTKIMTALIALENYNLKESTTINQNTVIGHTAELQPGHQFTIKDLLYAMMVPSGNDAALALARHHPSGYDAFVTLMNQKAKELQLQNTNFSNVSGLESPTHYSSARDLATISQAALEHQLFRDIVSTKETTITTLNTQYEYSLTNLNQLLFTLEGVRGIKTGWTPQAGDCLVTYTMRDGHGIITVVLNSKDRFADSQNLIEWVYQHYQWTQ